MGYIVYIQLGAVMPDDFKPDDPLSRTAFLLRAVRPVSVRCIEKIVRLSGNVIVESPA